MGKELDSTDHELLRLLSLDGRTPLKTLGATVGLAPSSVQERIARLKRDGVIEAFTIRVAASIHPVHAYMTVVTEAKRCAEVAPRLHAIADIKRCHSVAGRTDLVLWIEASDAQRLQAVRDEVAAIDGVVGVTTLPVLVQRFER